VLQGAPERRVIADGPEKSGEAHRILLRAL
jgi:hypothetical protein